MTEINNRKLKVFLSYASVDRPIIRDVYQRLKAEEWIDPWLDDENLVPGQDWDFEITSALLSADAVMLGLSNVAITREGYVRKEINNTLEKLKEKPEGSNYFIPVRLEECAVPVRLQKWQYVDFFPETQKDRAYQRILAGLKLRASILGVDIARDNEGDSSEKRLAEFSQELALTIHLPPHQIVEFFRSKAGEFFNTNIGFLN